MPRVVGRVFAFARGRSATVLSALGAAAVTNSMTSNQSATSFIVGDAFQQRFDALRIPRRVLSRSIEDTGTMLESLVPWHATALFMVATLGVPVAEYWHWQLLSLTNFVVAALLAITGIGCFYGEGEPAAVDAADVGRRPSAAPPMGDRGSMTRRLATGDPAHPRRQPRRSGLRRGDPAAVPEQHARLRELGRPRCRLRGPHRHAVYGRQLNPTVRAAEAQLAALAGAEKGPACSPAA
jgi:hypothetical protein